MKLSAVAAMSMAAAFATATPGVAAAAAPRSVSYVTIAGSGSRWQSVAISQWAEDVEPVGLTVNYIPDGSAAGRFFSDWLSREFPRQWNAFCARVTRGRVKAPCGTTEFFPVSGPGWHAQGESGSNAVIDYVTSRQSNGAIGYDEYAYALNAKAPVASIGNPDGRYVLPTARNVTEALTKAVVNENPRSPSYLQEDLAAAYANRSPGSYPLSYYGYLIVPRSGTKLPPIFSPAVGRSLSAFVLYGLCDGQRQAADLGHAPLPANVVAAGLRQVTQIPGHVAVPPLSKCER